MEAGNKANVRFRFVKIDMTTSSVKDRLKDVNRKWWGIKANWHSAVEPLLRIVFN